ncbi:DEAD/DEAH box helicase [Arenibaculum pallidiluteum]|uniref:DEAD/DEAH box helicase n=1 Tax=Arenibaculum pallidiluteum TaxID=2812559 RepID=UPI001A960F79|nr:DEAD/DEAH box helicase [Arenibaculum pallidiluteum]
MTEFTSLGLSGPLLEAVQAEGYTAATPIQAGAIPHLLAGRDVLGLAQTGTGKTAAFALPILQRLAEAKRKPLPKAPRALILTPTRELALQIAEGFQTYGSRLTLRAAVVHGGVSINPQAAALARGLDILVATPGRLLDLLSQGMAKLDAVEIFVLDEADRMLDMGFIRDVRKIVALVPKKRQTMLFSATMPDAVSELAASLLTDPARVEVTPPATTVERIEQKVLFVDKGNKRHLLADLFRDPAMTRAIVFSRTKHGANRVAEYLEKAGVQAAAIHGNKSQSARQRALDGFKAGQVRALVATDIAARGIDVDGVTHVVNFDLPNEPESYVHRIGRTARAGRDGMALSFCDAEEVDYLRAIEKAIRQPVPVHEEHAYHAAPIAGAYAARAARGGHAAGPRPGQAAKAAGKGGPGGPGGQGRRRRRSGRGGGQAAA